MEVLDNRGIAVNRAATRRIGAADAETPASAGTAKKKAAVSAGVAGTEGRFLGL